MKLKNQAVDLTDLAIGIIILGIIVSIGVTIMINVRDSRLTSLSSVTTTNESIHPNGATPLTNKWGIGVTQCNNYTHVIAPGNYTVAINSADGTITVTNTTGFGLNTAGTAWNCSYTWYNTSRSDWTVANASATGLGEYGNWFKIIVIVGVAAVVLGLIFMAFGRQGSVGESSGGGVY